MTVFPSSCAEVRLEFFKLVVTVGQVYFRNLNLFDIYILREVKAKLKGP
jgi:hypothetical protein